MPNTAQPLIDFKNALLAYDTQERTRNASWQRASTSSKNSSVCLICEQQMGGTDLPAAVVSLVIPRSLGGQNSMDNRMVSCTSCVKSRGSLDLLDPAFLKALGKPLPPSLVQLRSDCLLHSANHLSSLAPSSGLEKLEAVLRQRFTHPRCRVFAHAFGTTCFIGWVKRKGRSQAHGTVRGVVKGMGGVDLSTATMVVLQVDPSSFLDVVWALIELNTLVLPIPSLGTSVVLGENDWRNSWAHTFISPRDNLRRHKRNQQRLPWPARECVNHSGVEKKKARARQEKRRVGELERANILRFRIDELLKSDPRTRPSGDELLDLIGQQSWLMMTVEMRRASNQRNGTRLPLYP